jgi:hypothetical protein
MITHEEKRPGLGAANTGAGITGTNSGKPTLTAAQRQELIAAAVHAFPIGELDVQAIGGRCAWNTYCRPGRAAALRKGLGTLVRAGELAMELRPELELRQVLVAMSAFQVSLPDVLVNPFTGEWSGTKAAVAHRGREIAGALAEVALMVRELELEGTANP